MTTEKASQEKQVLNHLMRGHSITSLEALDMFKCLRLSDRIYILRRKYPIIMRFVKLTSGKTIGRYRMLKSGMSLEYEGNMEKIRTIFGPPFIISIVGKEIPITELNSRN